MAGQARRPTPSTRPFAPTTDEDRRAALEVLTLLHAGLEAAARERFFALMQTVHDRRVGRQAEAR